MTETLRYVVYAEASATPNEGPPADWQVLARSEGVSLQEAQSWQQYVSIAPMPLTNPNGVDRSQAVGVFAGPQGDFILARAYTYTQNTPIYQCIRLPQAVLQAWSGHWWALINETEHPLPVTRQEAPLEALPLPEAPTQVSNRRVEILNQLTTRYGVGVQTLLMLLEAILSHDAVTIAGFIPDLRARLSLTEGLSILLPASAQGKLTFSTHVAQGQPAHARLIFSEDPSTTRNRYLWVAHNATSQPAQPQHPYVRHLQDLWNTDLSAFAGELVNLDDMARQWHFNGNLGHDLESLIISEIRKDHRSIDDWKQLLAGEGTSSADLRPQDVAHLLAYALDARDGEIARALARLMDADPGLSDDILQRLDALLNDEPDAVYFFIRTRLAEHFDAQWLPRLHSAAVSALQVAIADGDNDTLMDWFKLIAREPAAYHLGNVLQEGIIAAQPRTHEDGVLGSRLIAFAAKRRPLLIDMLINDADVLSALDDPLGPALRDFSPTAAASAVALGREVGLVVLGRAAQYITTYDNAAAVFTAAQIKFLWSHWADPLDQLPSSYQPDTIITTLVANGVGHLPGVALQTMLAYLILNEDERLFTFASHLVQQTMLTPMLLGVFQEYPINVTQALKITNVLMEQKILPYQRGVDLYLRLAAYLEWQEEVMPLVEQSIRLVQQHGLLVPLDTYWQILELAERKKSDFVARVAVRQILAYSVQVKEERSITEAVITLKKRVAWSQSSEQAVINWWRAFIHEQPLSRLQQFNSAIEGRRGVDEMRSIVQTTIAMRRMLNKSTLEDFAGAVGTAYTLLQALSDSFDPVNKQAVNFDEETVRAEMDILDGELTPDERSVLAKNLRELAQLIIDMSDHRSKASLMRREEEIDRQLLKGEQQPQSAIDTMKWMSGYLNGSQNPDQDNT